MYLSDSGVIFIETYRLNQSGNRILDDKRVRDERMTG